jgi:phenylacetate-coenzyme A ligase PaaK-like adenylate-forming protein
VLNNLKKTYDKIPKKYIKFLKYIPDRVLFGKSYKSWSAKVSFDKSIIDQNLVEILGYARENTQYGKEHIPTTITVENVKEVLESLPLVSSHDLATNLEYYISQEFKGKNSYLTTTGGTGRNPTSILLSNESYGIEWAHMHHIWSLAGYKKSQDLKLTLRGKSLKGDKLIEFNPVYNELVVDTFKVKDSNFKEFLQELKKYDIKYIHGYPSLLKEFMVYFEKYNFTPKIKGIFLGSEGATVEDKKLISEFFDCKVVHWYGQSEKVALAVDVEENGLFRVYTSYGYPRVVDGELVATSFVNRALPLINYRMGDGAEIVEDDKYIYLKNLTSRRGKDFVYLDKNKKISTTAINLHSQIQNEILYYQIYQKEFAKIEIRVLQKATSNMDSDELLKVFGDEMRANLKDFEVVVSLVNEDEIVKSHRGKMILLVQELEV